MVRPYGDTTGDGMVQTSFTLPVPPGPRAEGAALQLARKMGIEPAMVVHSSGIGTGFTFFVVYGSVRHLVDLDAVRVEERAYPLLSPGEVNAAIKARLRRSLVVLGACIGTDAHTVLTEAVQLLERIAEHPQGLIQAIADGTFGITKRRPDGGKGLDGVVRKDADHYDPASELLERIHV